MNYASILLVSVMLLAGCATNSGGDTYSSSQMRRVQTLKLGTVVGVEYVTIKADSSVIGSLSGGAIGGIAGSTIGNGKGSDIATVLGALAGGIAGSATEDAINKEDGVRLTVRLDNGRTISVVQPANPKDAFAKGDRIQLITTDEQTRVAHAP